MKNQYRITLLLFLLSQLLLLSVGYRAYDRIRQWQNNQHAILTTSFTISNYRQLLSTVKDAETGQRGFLLTGDTAYLAPYEQARDSMDRYLTLLLAHPLSGTHKLRLAIVRSLIGKKMQELGQTIALRQKQDTVAALAMVKTNEGRRYMDTLRKEINWLESNANRQLLLQIQAYDQFNRATVALQLVTLLLLAALLMAAAFVIIRHQLQRQRKVNDAFELRERESRQWNEELRAANQQWQTLNETLTARKHFIEKVTETIPNSIYIFDLNSFQAVYTNKDLPAVLAYSPEQTLALGASVMKELVHPDDYERRRQYYQEFVTAVDHEVREIEFRLKHADGHYRCFMFTNAVFRRNSEGVPDQLVGISQDITPLKATENSLREALLQVQLANEELNAANEEIRAGNEQVSVVNEQLLTLNETLTERKHFIERLTDTIPNSIFVFDLTLFQAVYISRDIFLTLGYSPEAIVAMGSEIVKKLVHPEDFEAGIAYYRNFVTASEKEIREVAYRARHADGSYRWILIRGTVFSRNAQGIPNQMIGVTQDITDLKKNEANLREVLLQVQTTNQELNAVNEEIQAANENVIITNEELMVLNETLTERNHFIGKVTDTLPNSIFVFDLHLFQTIYLSKDIFLSLGHNPEEIIALGTETSKKLVHPQDLALRNDFFRNFVTIGDKETREVEYRARHVDGTYRWLLVRGTLFRRNAEGIPDQVIGIMQDITTLKETETNLRNTLARLTETNEKVLQTQEMLLQANEHLTESEEKARLLTEAVLDYSIFRLTPEGNVASWNEGAQRIQGYQAEEVIGQHCSAFFSPEAVDSQQPEYEMKTAREEGRYEDEGWRIRKDGSAFWANAVTTALYNSRKKLIGYSQIIRDLTQKVKNEELTRKNQALVAINADLDNFVYTASHDLKHPITNMESVLGVLRSQLEGRLTEKDRRWLEMISTSILRLKKTIKHLTEISRIQKGIEEAAEELDLEQLTEETKQDLTQLMEHNQAVVHIDLQIRHIRYAPENLRSILSNLLSNAIKYRHPQRSAEVWLSTHAEGQWVVLTVRDNGLGLSEEELPKLFKMFKRLHDHVEGTGIGLYMIKRIVENNGGKIVVDSQLGVGSTFTVYFTPIKSPIP